MNSSTGPGEEDSCRYREETIVASWRAGSASRYLSLKPLAQCLALFGGIVGAQRQQLEHRLPFPILVIKRIPHASLELLFSLGLAAEEHQTADPVLRIGGGGGEEVLEEHRLCILAHDGGPGRVLGVSNPIAGALFARGIRDSEHKVGRPEGLFRQLAGETCRTEVHRHGSHEACRILAVELSGGNDGFVEDCPQLSVSFE